MARPDTAVEDKGVTGDLCGQLAASSTWCNPYLVVFFFPIYYYYFSYQSFGARSKTSRQTPKPQDKLQNLPVSDEQCCNHPKRNEQCSSVGMSSVSYTAPSLHLCRPTLRHRRLLNRSRPIITKLTLHSSKTSSLQSSLATISSPYPPTPLRLSLDNSPMTSPPPPQTESTPSCLVLSSPRSSPSLSAT